MTLHVLISGSVQGVGFRQFIRYKAKKIGITGWVRNTQDRKVEAEFSGEQEKLIKMLHACRKGSLLSEVTDVQVNWEKKETSYQQFLIL